MGIHSKQMAAQSDATLAVPFAVASQQFCTSAQALGLRVEHAENATLVHFQLGRMRLSAQGSETRLELTAQTPASLQMLRDTIAERVKGVGLTLDWMAKSVLVYPANMSVARVQCARRLSPSYIRVTLEGPDLARFAEGGLHFRLLFGPSDAGWPTTDVGGVTQWPQGIKAWHRPVYTTRAVRVQDNGAAELDFDVFVHEGGRVTHWAQTVIPGTEIAITGPNGGQGPDPVGSLYLIGDETAVPVMSRVLARLPDKTRGKAFLFAPHADDVQYLHHPSGLELEWILRSAGQTPLGVLNQLTLPERDRFVFLAAERSEAIAARALLSAWGLTRDEFQCSAYWTAPD